MGRLPENIRFRRRPIHMQGGIVRNGIWRLPGADLTVTGGGGPSFPNEPGGYTVRYHHQFGVLPADDNGIAGTDWYIESLGSPALAIEADATAPSGNGYIMRTTFPYGMGDGGAPSHVNVGYISDFQRVSEQYISLRVKLENADWENQQVGSKLFYIGHGGSDGEANNESFFMFRNETEVLEAQNPLSFGIWQQGGIDDRYEGPNIGASAQFYCGVWNQIELRMVLSDIDTYNGTLEIWINGNKTHDFSDIIWRTTAKPLGFKTFKWDPVWGGDSGNVKTRDDFMLLDEVYVSGIPI